MAGVRNWVRYWRHPAVAGVDLIRTRYRSHAFTRHSHETFCIGVVEVGLENLGFGAGQDIAGVGGVILINPGEVHTGRPVGPGEWGYRALYASVDVVHELAGDLGIVGTPAFRQRIVHDQDTARAVLSACRAAETGDPLESSTLMRTVLTRLLHHYAEPIRNPVRPAGHHNVTQATEVLRNRMTQPPTLDELAELTGTGKFALLRAFRAVHGLPPFTYLNQLRITRVRTLLESGTRPADAAVAAGFVDQAHMTRHFHRLVGLPPGAYRSQLRRIR
jgi:AraC-like DNA-binding protein